MIVDFQHHYVPPEVAQKYGVYSTARSDVKQGGVAKATMHPKLFDLHAQLQDMEEAGVDVAVLSCLLGWDAPIEDCRLINDKFSEAQERSGGRFVGLAHIPPLQAREAAAELDRAFSELGLAGVTIPSQVGGEPLDSPNLYGFYQKVCELDIPIFVHPAMVLNGYELIKDYDLSRIIGRELDLSLAVTRIIAGGVFDRFPTLKFVIAHFGGGIASVKDRLSAKAYRFGTPLKCSFDEYFDLFYFDMSGFEDGETALRCALAGIRPDRMVFATDYPQDFSGMTTNTGRGVAGIREYVDRIRALDLPDSVKAGMLGGTAMTLLRIDETSLGR
ncbi:MAG TPA: amidohydrolase family protein [bacterium]|nr:amidohydrolase family protein [bacterium]